MNLPPGTRPVRLADGRVSPPVDVAAAVVRNFPPARLADVEAGWSPARRELAAALAAAGSVLENSHWDWTMKGARAERGDLRLVAVEADGIVQGLMALAARSRPAVQTPGRAVVYVDYLEAAPWNLRAPGRLPRFGGVGSVLIGDAIRLSLELGLDGLVGLHALPQAERFYERTCRMARLGPDPDYHELVYFEYPEGAGPAWLAGARSGG